MKIKFFNMSVPSLALSLAGLLLLHAPALRAQAQENIADVQANTQTNGDTGQISPAGQEPIQQAPDMQGQAAQGPSLDSMNADGPAPDDKLDPPSRAARLSYIDGSVSLQPGGTGDWGTATKNRPMTIGDKLWSDNGSRAEIQAGQAALHLGSMTAISFLNLDQNVTQVRLAEGKLNFRVRELREGENYEIDTPNLAFTVKQAGAFRIDVNENGDYTSVTVVRGAGDITAAGQTYSVTAGQRADVSGTDANVKYIPGTASEPDALDRWAQERDLKEDNSTSARYVSRDTVGYSDLDDNGTWSEQPEVGNVWTPNNVPPDWAPYSDGSWNYVAPWGWSWVDYSPWGFAPFHYGRWGIYGGRWGWCPGPIYVRPYYGPAFVGFLGGGGFGFGIGFGFGFGYGHGWFPLGWGEPFRPWYHCGANYWHNVNVHNTYIRNTNVITARNYNNYRYASNTRAVTTASHNAFVNGERINRSSQHLTEASLRGSHVTNGINASPTRNSYLGAGRTNGRVATPSASVQNRSVMARTAPAATHEQVRTFNSAGANGGRSTGFGATNNSRPNTTSSGFNNSRQSQLSSNRPPEARTQSSGAGSSARGWSAQGNTTDSGRAPQGFGANSRPANTMQSARINSANRPPNAGSYNSSSAYGNRGNTYNGAVSRNTANRPPSSMGGNRAYNSQSYNGNRSYGSQPNYGNRSYNSPSYNGNRGYSSAPSYRGNSGYSAPHNYSAPHSSGGGGGSYHGGGSSGGGSHSSGGGGGGSHGGGGGGSHGGGGGGHH